MQKPDTKCTEPGAMHWHDAAFHSLMDMYSAHGRSMQGDKPHLLPVIYAVICNLIK